MDYNQREWCRSQAEYMRITINPKIVAARSGVFTEWAMMALERMARDHNNQSTLIRIYDDLLSAWFIADQAAPITMSRLTFGQFVIWYEKAVMPSWDNAGATSTPQSLSLPTDHA